MRVFIFLATFLSIWASIEFVRWVIKDIRDDIRWNREHGIK